MATVSHAVDITDGKFRLDTGVIAKVLCQPSIADKPVAVVGIAGAMRTGKSFALSFLMRYLRRKGWKNPTWIGDGETSANDGVEWKCGKRPDTKGIRVWNEVFVVEKENGDELAVLLVDTQGLFDKTMTRENNMRLLTFTVLFCSRLMLNVRGQINDRDLGYLQFFTQYAKTVLEEFKDETPFQDLIFLIRDWQYPDDDPYGLDGGRAYLDEVFEMTGNNEANCVRRDLRSTFGNIQSFLMPHPGNNVRKSDFRGHNSELDPEFLRCMNDLAHAVLDSRTLKERLHNGNPMTGRHIWSLLNDCNRAFEDGATPEVKNMVEGFARMKNRLACEDGLKKFNEKFSEMGNASYFEAQSAALQYFEANTKFGPENFREEYRQRLILDCQDQFKRLSAWDEYHKLRAKTSSSEKLHEMWTNYKEAMKRDMEDRYKTHDAIGKLHGKHSEAALLEYQTETAKEAAFHEEHLQILKDVIEKSYCKLKAVNDERHILESLGSQEDMVQEYEAYLLLHTIAQQYREEFEKYSIVYIEEEKLKEQIGKLQTSYLDILSQHWDSKGPNIDDFREILLRLLEEECQDCLKQNGRNKEVFEDSIEKYLMEQNVQYQEEMHQIIEKSYCVPSDLQKAHDFIVRKLTEDLKNASGELEVSEKEDVLAKAQRNFSSVFSDITKKNERNRREKPQIDWDAIKNTIVKGTEVAAVVTLAIQRFTSLLRSTKAAHSASTVLSAQILPSAEALAVAVPYVALGVGVAATVGVIAYCVYKHYKNRKALQN